MERSISRDLPYISDQICMDERNAKKCIPIEESKKRESSTNQSMHVWIRSSLEEKCGHF